MTVRACSFLGKWFAAVGILLIQIHKIGYNDTLGEPQRGFNGIGQTLTNTVLDHQSVHYHFDGVLLLLGEFDVVRQLLHFAINQRSRIAITA